jgi:hypothetical protein
MEIEQKPFNFEELGLPVNFLEINAIDSEFFYALTDDLKMEILLDYLPKDQPNHSQETDQLEFLNTLPPNLREEVLLTYPDEILQSLPESIQ